MEISIALVIMAAVAAGAFIIGKRGAATGAKSGEMEAKDAEIRIKETKIEQLTEEIKTLTSERDVSRNNAAMLEKQVQLAKADYEKQVSAIKDSYDRQLHMLKENNSQQIEAIRQMYAEQTSSQLKLIKEQMQTTSENVLKMRQEELGAANKEQVSKIVDPLQQTIKQMNEVLKDSKEKQQEALLRLDATIQANMKQSEHLTDSADRLARALTGEVKVQGNFGELKLKQLLEDLGLKEGEQFTSQQALKDKFKKSIKSDEGKNLIPDFILHFPNNRDVIVDSKVSFTAYEKYMNTQDEEQRKVYLQEHLKSVRGQVKNLAGKDYSKYLDSGYTKLNFVIMYIHTEGALNLALLNDGSLWREAYDDGVLVLGPQTMYMNLRILELMWTQTKQIKNQEEIIKQANSIISRVQFFSERFNDVEKHMRETVSSMESLKVVTSSNGRSIITAARQLIKAGAKAEKDKKSKNIFDEVVYIDEEDTLMLGQETPEQ